MSTNKTTSRPRRQTRTLAGRHVALQADLENHKSALERMRLEKIDLAHRHETDTKQLTEERNFWFWMVYNFRFHHSNHVVTQEARGDISSTQAAVSQATLDLLMAPGEPRGAFTQNYRQDHQLHRIMAGRVEMSTNSTETDLRHGRLVNAGTISS